MTTTIRNKTAAVFAERFLDELAEMNGIEVSYSERQAQIRIGTAIVAGLLKQDPAMDVEIMAGEFAIAYCEYFAG